MDLTSQKSAIVRLHQAENISDTETFKKDVTAGLNDFPKTLPSMYFYNAEGSKLFQKIMNLPEYYLTRSEFLILTEQKEQIIQSFYTGEFFHLIDLGAGDGKKTKILLNQLQNDSIPFEYIPVDISADVLEEVSNSLEKEMPDLKVQPVAAEYFAALKWLQQNKTKPKVLLFLGSNIGNFEKQDGIDFLIEIRKYLAEGDKIFMGCDLRKEPRKIRAAYDDSEGVTAEFNYNLLRRINKELGADFDLSAFEHFAEYDPIDGVMRSFLISKKEQTVHLKSGDEVFNFKAWEAIHTENSYKYSLPQIEKMAAASGFKIDQYFTDKADNFTDVLLTTA